MPVDHVGIRVALGCNESDVFGNWRVSRASPLAIHHLVEIVGVGDIRRLHKSPFIVLYIVFYACLPAGLRAISVSSLVFLCWLKLLHSLRPESSGQRP